MGKKYSHFWFISLLFTDVVVVSLNWNISYFFRFYWFNYPIVEYPPSFLVYLNTTIIITLVSLVCFFKSKMYYRMKFIYFKQDIPSVIQTVSFLFLILLGISFFFRGFSFSRIHACYFVLLNICTILLVHWLYAKIINYLKIKGKLITHVMIIGSGHTAIRFISQLEKIKALGLKYVGYVSQNKNQIISNYLGNYENIPSIIKQQKIQQVYIALDTNKQSDLTQLNSILAEQVVDLYTLPDIENTLNINTEMLDFEGVPIIALRQTLNPFSSFLKRSLDLLGVFVAFVLFLPLWIIIPILIKLTSKGPIFYFQDRMGIDGKCFKMIKFRSMPLNAEHTTGAVWAKKNDIRTTKIGSFLRKTSLDELPQLLNVFLGQMSLVGPRPERDIFIQKFKTQIPNYMLRHKMKTGMTGWAQINGWRGNTSLEKRIEYDLYYLTHWSIWFDIKIIFMTFVSGFLNKNAY